MNRETTPGAGASWLVLEYAPVGLFSLKSSMATSAVGKTLLVPTPYAIKMALIDAAFRIGYDYGRCAQFLKALVDVDVRVAPPERAVVTHTYLKVRQEPKEPEPLRPYISSIAYREVVFHHGLWQWAFRSRRGVEVYDTILECAPVVNYIGKRGSFVQFIGHREVSGEIGPGFTQPLDGSSEWVVPPRAHIAQLDDFGPQADMETLSSYSPKKATRDKHRKFVRTVVPLGLTNTGPGFSEYRA